MVIFDPQPYLQAQEAQLKQRVATLVSQGRVPKIAAILYNEDRGSQLYTWIKSELAAKIGIGYEIHEFCIRDGVEKVMAVIKQLNDDPSVTGIIVQKPMRKVWVAANLLDGQEKDIKQAFDSWWRLQTQAISPAKDVDGLHPSIIGVIAAGQLVEQKRVLPATARAVLEILATAKIDLNGKKIVILGKSDLLGLPLYTYFLNKKYQVEMIGHGELESRLNSGQKLTDADVVISATGVKNLVTGEMLKQGAAVVDVGEPRGDVDAASVASRASFLTPVPGGVGPMTVMCLMANCVDLC